MVMAFFAQRLPVGLIPEQALIATVWNDMVNHSRRCGAMITQTLCAQRILF